MRDSLISFILYNLSRNIIDFNKPYLIHSHRLCIYLSNFTNVLSMCLCFCLFNNFMYDTITNIRVCSQININFVALFRITDLLFNVFYHFIILFVNFNKC